MEGAVAEAAPSGGLWATVVGRLGVGCTETRRLPPVLFRKSQISECHWRNLLCLKWVSTSYSVTFWCVNYVHLSFKSCLQVRTKKARAEQESTQPCKPSNWAVEAERWIPGCSGRPRQESKEEDERRGDDKWQIYPEWTKDDIWRHVKSHRGRVVDKTRQYNQPKECGVFSPNKRKIGEVYQHRILSTV